MVVKKSAQLPKTQDKQVHVNFLVSESLRNEFKSKVATKGKTVRDVLEAFMKEYIKK